MFSSHFHKYVATKVELYMSKGYSVTQYLLKSNTYLYLLYSEIKRERNLMLTECLRHVFSHTIIFMSIECICELRDL